MSRSGYTEDDATDWDFIRWRGQVASAIRGKRGQAFLRELVAALARAKREADEAEAELMEAAPGEYRTSPLGVAAMQRVGL